MNKTLPSSPSPSPAPAPAPQEITKDTLAAAANRDDAATKELLVGGETERSAQVERIRLALDALKGTTASNGVERARVARVSRELMDAHLEGVRAELQTNADEKLKELESTMMKIRDVASQTERASLPALSVESIRLEAGAVTRELRDGNWMTWAKYAGIALAAGVTAKWIWDHTIGWLWGKAAGDQKKPGFLRRAASWTVGIAGAALGVIGLSRLTASFPNLLPGALRVAQKAAEKTAEGAKDGWDAVPGVTVRNILDLAGENGRTAEVERKNARGEYADESEYQNERVKALALDGVQMVWEGTGAHLMRAGKHLVVKEMEFVGAIINFVSSGGSEDAGWEIYEVWVNGTVVYASSFGALSAAITLARTGSPSRALITLATESAVWPVTVGKKLNEARVLLFTRNGNVTLREIAGSPGFQWNRLMGSQYNPVNLLRSQTTGRMDALVKEWQGWKELERSVRGGGDRNLIKSLQEKCEAIEQEILRSANALRTQRAGGTALDLTAELKHILDKGLNLDSLAHALNELAEPSGARLASLVEDWARLQGNLRNAGSNALLKSQFQQGLDDTLKEIERTTEALRAQLRAGKTIDGLSPALKTIVEDGTDTIKLSRLLDTGSAADATVDTGRAAAATNAATDAADATVDAGRAAAATTDTATEALETGDEWVRAATQARTALLAPDATDEAARSVDEAINACKAIGMKPADALKAVRDPSSLFVLTRTPRQYAAALAVANESGDAVQNLRRIGAFLAGFDKLDDAARAAKIFDKNLLRTLAQSGLQPDGIANILKSPALKGALDTVDDLDGVVKGLIWWEHTKSISGMINVGGAVISAVMLGVDIASYVEMRNRLTNTIKNLEANLKTAGFECIRSVPGKNAEDPPHNTFRHPTTKQEIDLKLLSENVNNLSTEQGYRVGAGVVGTGAALATVIAPSLALGPAGLIILGIHIGVEAGLVVAGDQRSRTFLRNTPTSVLAVIGMGQTVGKSEKDVLDESSSWLWSDAINSAETNEADKALFRKKAVSVMFFQELGALMKDSPEVAMRVLAESNRSQAGQGPQLQDAGTFLDEENGAFWKGDFDRIVKPYLAARLFQMSKDPTVKWSNFRDLKIDEGVLDWENVSEADMRLALREAARVYAQHLKEKSYLDEKKAAADLAALPRQEKVTTVQSIETRAHLDLQTAVARENAKLLGTQGAFGKSVAELDDGSGKTSMERYLADLTKRLDDRANDSAAETKKAYDESTAAQAVDVALLLTGAVRLPDANAGKDRASMGRKEIFTGANPGAEGNVRLEDLAGASAREKERPLAVADVRAVIEKGRSLYGELEPVGTAMRQDSVWYAQPSHFQKLKEYSYSLQRQPAIENEKAVQAFLGTVKTLSEGFSWENGQFGSEFLAKRNDAFRASIAALAAMNRVLDARTYHLAPVERASVRDEVVCVPKRERFLFFPGADVRGDPSVLYVESGGETIEHRPTPGREYKETVPGGKLLCRMQGRMEKGKQVYDYTWSFERGTDAKPGTELYAYMKSDGAEQPGVRVTLPEVKTKKLRVNVDRPLITESIDGINGTALITLTYRTRDGGTEPPLVGSLHQILQSKKVGWKRLSNTDPKTGEKAEWTEFVPKDGIVLESCQIDHFDKPQSTLYEWPQKKPAPVVAAPAPKVNRAA